MGFDEHDRKRMAEGDGTGKGASQDQSRSVCTGAAEVMNGRKASHPRSGQTGRIDPMNRNLQIIAMVAAVVIAVLWPRDAWATAKKDPRIDRCISRGLEWIANTQSRLGHWSANDGRYPTAMTALAGIALLQEGSTTTQGKYAQNIRRAVDYLSSRSRANGLIGDPTRDDRYTYGHGYSMLFLSQVLGEEEDAARRNELVEVLTKAVEFCGRAQTDDGGWGYVSAKDGGGFDEGSTTITQVQGLRGCRNAGISVPNEIIEKAIKYIHKCTGDDGAVQYSSKGGGPRPAITAAAIACLYNAGDYDDRFVPKMFSYAEKNLSNISNQSFGHWHYAHYYYAQVKYREGGENWGKYRDQIYPRLINESSEDRSGVYWTQGHVGTIYTTAVNLTILQLDKNILPIYQR
ncbi:MAG: terpene cyclase/mutase family protein [Pirellulales bacterium]|nr:terpene cyclase/mutase family protein [Pirellulales bacterium]